MQSEMMQKELNKLWYDVRSYGFNQLIDMAKPHVNKLCYYFTKTMSDDNAATKKVAEMICTPLYIDRQITRNETNAFATLFPSMAKLGERTIAQFIANYAKLDKMAYLNYYNTLPTEVRYHIAYVAVCILGTDSNLEMSEYEIISELIYRIF